jgi:hypothetical protein
MPALTSVRFIVNLPRAKSTPASLNGVTDDVRNQAPLLVLATVVRQPRRVIHIVNTHHYISCF